MIKSQYKHQEPDSLPLSLQEVKHYLRVDFESDDEMIKKMIAAATSVFERNTSLALINQVWSISYTDLEKFEFELSISPVVKLLEIELINWEYCRVNIDVSSVILLPEISTIRFRQFPYAYMLKVKYLAGMSEASEYIPSDIKSVLLTHIAAMYEHRSIMADIPNHLYQPFRKQRM